MAGHLQTILAAEQIRCKELMAAHLRHAIQVFKTQSRDEQIRTQQLIVENVLLGGYNRMTRAGILRVMIDEFIDGVRKRMTNKDVITPAMSERIKSTAPIHISRM